ncbi:hypothetical protein CASFOL_012524 [Castilleja foliolosa]|uniref:Uncharacterized protein n=1 Tax=Castilleja foliolosa TaxID=1961234 RepID=A0ABD3DL27_9LAMI
MDNTDWTFSSCSWLWEDDIDFKKECLDSHWTNGEDKSAEADNTPLPDHQTNDNNTDQVKKKKTLRGINRGKPWTEDEHRRFLDGLEKFGKGDWKSIARFSVQTKSNSQVASHAQKYFKRLNSTNKANRRHSINDVTIHDRPVTMPADGNNGRALINALSEIERLMQVDVVPTSITTNGSFGIQAIPEVKSLVQNNVIPSLSSFEITIAPTTTSITTGSFGIPAITEVQPLVQDNVVPNLSSFGFFPSINDVQPVMQDNGVAGSSSSGVPMVDSEVFVLPHFLD